MEKELVCTIGYQHYVIDPHDAVVLLGIAKRMIAVNQTTWNTPYRPKDDAEPFVTAMSLADVDMEPEAPESPPDPVAAPLQITEQRKITHAAPFGDDVPF